MDKNGELIGNRSLRFVRLLPGPIDRVWEYLTDANKRSKWFCGGTSAKEAGEELSLVFFNSQLGIPNVPAPGKYVAFGDGFESKAKVIEMQKPHLFKIEWEGIVTFQLEELEDQVKLTLTHEKLKGDSGAMVGTLAGWHTHLDILVDHCEGRSSDSFWTTHCLLEMEYTSMVKF